MQLAAYQITNLHVQLSGSRFEEDGAFGLVTIEFDNLLLVNISNKGYPLIDDILFELINADFLTIVELFDYNIGIQFCGKNHKAATLVLFIP